MSGNVERERARARAHIRYSIKILLDAAVAAVVVVAPLLLQQTHRSCLSLCVSVLVFGVYLFCGLHFCNLNCLTHTFFSFVFWVQIEHKLHTELKMISHTLQAIIKMIIIAYSWYVDMPYNFQCFSMVLLLFPDWKSQQIFRFAPKNRMKNGEKQC